MVDMKKGKKDKKTTIAIPVELARKLEEKKVHERQAYYEVIEDMMEED